MPKKATDKRKKVNGRKSDAAMNGQETGHLGSEPKSPKKMRLTKRNAQPSSQAAENLSTAIVASDYICSDDLEKPSETCDPAHVPCFWRCNLVLHSLNPHLWELLLT